jgi:Mn-dependent DtxR family transcriptional regulator
VADQVRPHSLPAAERAVLLNIETHTNWSASAVVTALFEKGLITRRSGGEFVLTDQGRITPEELMQNRRRHPRERWSTRRFPADQSG